MQYIATQYSLVAAVVTHVVDVVPHAFVVFINFVIETMTRTNQLPTNGRFFVGYNLEMPSQVRSLFASTPTSSV
jgi:hypothetical protein